MKNSDEVSLKDLLSMIKKWIAFLLSRWKTILIAGIVTGALGMIYAIYSTPKYKAELMFVLSNGSNSSGLAGLVGQLGIDLNSGSGTDAFEGDNIVELFKSKNIVRRALFRPIGDSSDLLINLVANESGLAEAWQKKEHLRKAFPFRKEAGLPQAGLQDSLFREIHKFILKSYLSVEKVDKKLNFYNVSTNSPNETLSIQLSSNLVNEAAKFYIETKTKTARENLAMMQREADSLRYLLGGAINSAAYAIDQTFNLNEALQISRTPARKNQIQAEVIGTAYGEVVKNLEIAKITLQRETPLFQIIDQPLAPLKKERKSKVVFFILGGFIGSIFCIGILSARRLYANL